MLARSFLFRTYSINTKKFELSKIKNGIQVASENSIGPFCAIGVLVKSGSRYESEKYLGSSHSTKNKNTDQIAAAIEELGGTLLTTESKDCVLYSAAVHEKMTDKALNLISEIILEPKISQQDIFQVADIVNYEINERSKKYDEMLPELTHIAAWNSKTYGNSIFTIPANINNLTPEIVQEFRNSRFKPANCIISGAGIEHEKLLNSVEKYFGNWSATNVELEKRAVEYTGGKMEMADEETELFHCGLAFKGVKLGDNDAFALAVLQLLLGGGSAFSAGGPGKGMYSRLYSNVLNRYHWVESAKCFSSPYKEDGIFGITGSCIPSHSSNLVKVLLNEIISIDDKLSLAELERARNQAKSMLLMGLESRLIQVEDIARQVQCLGTRMPIQQIIERLDNVTQADLTRVKDLLLKCKMSFVSYGNLSYKPKVDSIASNFGILI